MIEQIHNNSNIIIISLQIIGYFIFFIVKKTSSSYLKKKGENLATKQDIGTITSEIESIKADLSLKNQSKFNFKEKKRVLIYEVLETYNYWFYSVINFSFNGYNIKNREVFKEYQMNIESYRIKFNVAESNLRLFHLNPKFEKIKLELQKNTTLLQNKLNITIYEFELKLCELEELKYFDDYIKRDSIRSKIQNELVQINENYCNNELIEYGTKLAELHKNFTLHLKNELENS